IYKTDLESWIRENITTNKIQEIYNSLIRNGVIRRIVENKTNRVVVGMPVEIFKLLSASPSGMYRM
ncbi:MAG: hypothetical protein J6X55_05735, partial [Victivallales bacterium]|nr:hypothetical protein [Victivallales bacterium]